MEARHQTRITNLSLGTGIALAGIWLAAMILQLAVFGYAEQSFFAPFNNSPLAGILSFAAKFLPLILASFATYLIVRRREA